MGEGVGDSQFLFVIGWSVIPDRLLIVQDQARMLAKMQAGKIADMCG